MQYFDVKVINGHLVPQETVSLPEGEEYFAWLTVIPKKEKMIREHIRNCPEYQKESNGSKINT